MDSDIPKKLGPYIIEEMIGRGGMGTVYRGTDPENAESAAIKFKRIIFTCSVLILFFIHT